MLPSRLISLLSAKPNFLHLGWLVDAAFEPDDCSIAQTQALDSISIPNVCSSPSFTISYYCIFRIRSNECHSSRVPTAAGHFLVVCEVSSPWMLQSATVTLRGGDRFALKSERFTFESGKVLARLWEMDNFCVQAHWERCDLGFGTEDHESLHLKV